MRYTRMFEGLHAEVGDPPLIKTEPPSEDQQQHFLKFSHYMWRAMKKEDKPFFRKVMQEKKFNEITNVAYLRYQAWCSNLRDHKARETAKAAYGAAH